VAKIVVYADESGTHDLSARQPGANVAVLGGYAGFAEDWETFEAEWRAALSQYRVPFFHFCEFSNKKKCAKDTKSPYFGWDGPRRHEFLFTMAKIAGNRVRFPCAGSFLLAHFHSDKRIKIALRNMGLNDVQINGPHLVYFSLFHEFFDAFLRELNARHPDFAGVIEFVFDRKDDDRYWALSANQMFELFSESDPRFESIRFSDKKIDLPLQAADMFAYRTHQIFENQHKSRDHHVFKPLDYTLFGNFTGHDDFMTYFAKTYGVPLPQLKK
jgi:hypothetical protein